MIQMMKRIFISLLLLITVMQVMAVPAKKGNATVTQPDGSTVTISLYGDEWLHYETTADGYSVVRNDNGYYVYAEKKQGKLVPTTVVAHDMQQRDAQEASFLLSISRNLKPEMSQKVRMQREQVIAQQKKNIAKHLQMKKAGKLNDAGTEPNYKSLVILVQFNDKSFSRTDYSEVITNMINQQNYTGYQNGGSFVSCTGSVRDYFTDNSGGNFRPQFDVYGPYTVNYSVYDPNGLDNVVTILNAAVDAADADVDFSQYDNDGDGVVDNIYFILAGNGSNYSGNNQNLWWPHRSVIYDPQTYYYIMKDDVYLYDYASSVELYGWVSQPSSVHIDGIGTFCHEFSHVLGLPDFYDADYEANGSSNHPDEWSVMAGGSYMNDGRTPVGYTLAERLLLDFTEEQQITGVGSYTLQPINTSNSGYTLVSASESEMFTIENRQKVKWDTYLPGHGMLVFRVDFSSETPWANNTVNNNANHNYYQLLRAGNGTGATARASDPFPGSLNKTTINNGTTPSLKTWAGLEAPYGLKNITEQDGVISFQVENLLEVSSITLPESVILGKGMTFQLDPVIEPTAAPHTLTWTSANPAVVTVSDSGLLTGVATGTTTVTVKTDNNKQAVTTVNVLQLDNAQNIAELKAKDDGAEAVLTLTDVHVNYVKGTDAYVCDATGAIIMRNMPMTLKAGDVLNGSIYVKNTTEEYMPVAESVTNVSSASNVKITDGIAEAKKVKLADLTPADYAQYIEIEQVEMVRESEDGAHYYMYKEGEDELFLENKFNVSLPSKPSQLADYRFTQKGIYGTRQATMNGNVYDDIYPTAPWTRTRLTKYNVNYTVTDGGHATINDETVNGTGTMSFYKGTVINLTAVPDENYELESVLLNNDEVTSRFAYGATYTIEGMEGNVTVKITFKQQEIVDAIGRIFASHVGETVTVYDIDGRRITETTIGIGGSINLPAVLRKGVYVVKMQSAAYKIVNR